MFFNKKEDLAKRKQAFNQMNAAFLKLIDLRDAKHDSHNEIINEVKNLLESVISQTVPMPSQSTVKDYYSKTIEYVAIYKLTHSIISSVQDSRDIKVKDLELDWSNPLS